MIAQEALKFLHRKPQPMMSGKTSIFQGRPAYSKEDCAAREPRAGSKPTGNSHSRRLRCLENHIAQQNPRPGADARAVHYGISSSQAPDVGPRRAASGTRLPSLPRGRGSISATRKRERWRLFGDVEAALGGSDSEW